MLWAGLASSRLFHQTTDDHMKMQHAKTAGLGFRRDLIPALQQGVPADIGFF